MYSKNIRMKFTIPVEKSSDEMIIDDNGICYESLAFEESCKAAKGIPILVYNPDGTTSVVGVVDKAEFSEDMESMVFDGLIFGGGTEESVKYDNGCVSSVELRGIGMIE